MAKICGTCADMLNLFEGLRWYLVHAIACILLIVNHKEQNQVDNNLVAFAQYFNKTNPSSKKVNAPWADGGRHTPTTQHEASWSSKHLPQVETLKYPTDKQHNSLTSYTTGRSGRCIENMYGLQEYIV